MTRPPLLSLEEAVAALKAGRLVIFPTETVYGLGCDAFNAEAAAAIFLLKKRAPAMPLPLIIASRAQLLQAVYPPGPAASRLMELFWPGPLSLLLPVRPGLPDLLAASSRRVAVRHSSHPAAQALCLALGGPVVATSANLSGSPSAGRISDLDPLIVAGTAGIFAPGPEPAGGAPSTLAEASESRGMVSVRLLRHGALSAEAISAAGFAVQTNKHRKALRR